MASGRAGRNEAGHSRVVRTVAAGKEKGQLVRANWPFIVICWRNAFSETASARYAAKAAAKLSAASLGASAAHPVK